MSDDAPLKIQTHSKRTIKPITELKRRERMAKIRSALDTGKAYDRLSKEDKLAFLSTVMVHQRRKTPSKQLWDYTIHLSDKMITTVGSETEKEATDRFKRSIKLRLRKATGKSDILFWFVIETKKTNGTPTDPHLHGLVMIDEGDLAMVRTALKKVGGEKSSRKNVLVMRPLTHPHDAQRVAGYFLKNAPHPYVQRKLTQGTRNYWNLLVDYNKRMAAEHIDEVAKDTPDVEHTAKKPAEPHTSPATDSDGQTHPKTTPSPYSNPPTGGRTLEDVVATYVAWHGKE